MGLDIRSRWVAVRELRRDSESGTICATGCAGLGLELMAWHGDVLRAGTGQNGSGMGLLAKGQGRARRAQHRLVNRAGLLAKWWTGQRAGRWTGSGTGNGRVTTGEASNLGEHEQRKSEGGGVHGRERTLRKDGRNKWTRFWVVTEGPLGPRPQGSSFDLYRR